MDVWKTGKWTCMYPKFRTATGIATGTGTGIEKELEVGLRVGRNKKK